MDNSLQNGGVWCVYVMYYVKYVCMSVVLVNYN